MKRPLKCVKNKKAIARIADLDAEREVQAGRAHYTTKSVWRRAKKGAR